MDLQVLTKNIETVAGQYSEKFNITYTNDWFLLKLQEEFGEMTQAYLMLTQRTRRKIPSTQEGKQVLAEEIADTLAYILLFAKNMHIDPEEAIIKKWFAFLP